MSDSKKQIAFMGTEEYRHLLQQEALKRKVKVQKFLEDAVSHYLAQEGGVADRKIDAGTFTKEEQETLDVMLRMLRDDDPTIQGQVSIMMVAIQAYSQRAKKMRKPSTLLAKKDTSSDKLTGTKSR